MYSTINAVSLTGHYEKKASLHFPLGLLRMYFFKKWGQDIKTHDDFLTCTSPVVKCRAMKTIIMADGYFMRFMKLMPMENTCYTNLWLAYVN